MKNGRKSVVVVVVVDVDVDVDVDLLMGMTDHYLGGIRSAREFSVVAANVRPCQRQERVN